MLKPISKNGVFIGYADARQIEKHGLIVHEFPEVADVVPVEVAPSEDVVQKPKVTIRKVR